MAWPKRGATQNPSRVLVHAQLETAAQATAAGGCKQAKNPQFRAAQRPTVIVGPHRDTWGQWWQAPLHHQACASQLHVQSYCCWPSQPGLGAQPSWQEQEQRRNTGHCSVMMSGVSGVTNCTVVAATWSAPSCHSSPPSPASRGAMQVWIFQLPPGVTCPGKTQWARRRRPSAALAAAATWSRCQGSAAVRSTTSTPGSSTTTTTLAESCAGRMMQCHWMKRGPAPPAAVATAAAAAPRQQKAGMTHMCFRRIWVAQSRAAARLQPAAHLLLQSQQQQEQPPMRVSKQEAGRLAAPYMRRAGSSSRLEGPYLCLRSSRRCR